jgi:hypothetical protein
MDHACQLGLNPEVVNVHVFANIFHGGIGNLELSSKLRASLSPYELHRKPTRLP